MIQARWEAVDTLVLTASWPHATQHRLNGRAGSASGSEIGGNAHGSLVGLGDDRAGHRDCKTTAHVKTRPLPDRSRHLEMERADGGALGRWRCSCTLKARSSAERSDRAADGVECKGQRTAKLVCTWKRTLLDGGLGQAGVLCDNRDSHFLGASDGREKGVDATG